MSKRTARDADIWWAMQRPERKIQVHSWLEKEDEEHPQTAGQLALRIPDELIEKES
jgi:hypothetical protein